MFVGHDRIVREQGFRTTSKSRNIARDGSNTLVHSEQKTGQPLDGIRRV